ncbi:MAG: hypothetical protein EXS23_07035 [Pedosphaera sp.]|nr:hypothetical protein [Pedosphaera sp.]
MLGVSLAENMTIEICSKGCRTYAPRLSNELAKKRELLNTPDRFPHEHITHARNHASKPMPALKGWKVIFIFNGTKVDFRVVILTV